LLNVQVLATHVVGPVYPIPPHCPYFGTLPVGELGGTEVEVGSFVELEETGGGAGEVVPVKVLLMGPNLMLEYVTEAFGDCDSTSFGLPLVVGQVPRTEPGMVAVVG